MCCSQVPGDGFGYDHAAIGAGRRARRRPTQRRHRRHVYQPDAGPLQTGIDQCSSALHVHGQQQVLVLRRVRHQPRAVEHVRDIGREPHAQLLGIEQVAGQPLHAR